MRRTELSSRSRRFATTLSVLTLATAAATCGGDSSGTGPTDPTGPEPSPSGGALETLVASLPAGAGGLEVDAQGNIYTGDFGPTVSQGNGSDVYRVDPTDGSFAVFATGIVGASGNAFDAQGNLLQAGIGSGNLSRIDPDGVVETFATGFTSPVGVTLAANGDVFVANCGANSVSRVSPAGDVTTHAASGLLDCPNGITAASDGNLYVSNFGDGWVVRITPDGTVTRFAEIPGGSNAHILFGNGRLYVAGRARPRLYELSLTGTLTILAGTGTRGISDGPALQATLSIPNDLALSPDGSILYFNDVARTTGGTGVVNPTMIRLVRLATG